MIYEINYLKCFFSYFRAVVKNNAESIRTLLDLGASPNYKDSKGLTPLYLAVSHSADVTLTEMLLHDHAIVGAQDLQGWQEVHQVRIDKYDFLCKSNG